MKKIISLVCIGFILFSCTKKEGNLTISGEIKGLSQGKLYIQKLQDTVFKPIKVIKFEGNSKFETDITIGEPEVLYLYLDRGVSNSLDNNIAFFAEKGNITINSDIKSFIGKAEIKGNKNQELMNEYRKVISSFNNKNLEYIEQKVEAIINKNQKAADSLELLEKRMIVRKYQYTINFCVNNGNYEVSPFIALSEIPNANIEYLDTIRKSLSENVSKSKYGKLLNNYIEETR